MISLLRDRFACHCGADCDWHNVNDGEPCWGEIAPYGISGDPDFCHACEGHYPVADGGSYKPYSPAETIAQKDDLVIHCDGKRYSAQDGNVWIDAERSDGKCIAYFQPAKD